MDKFYVFIGLFVVAIALFNRELLVQKESFRIILGVSIILFFAGLILHFTAVDRESSCGALLSPLVSLGLYRFCRSVFLICFKREPRDTFFNWWGADLFLDSVFNVVYFVTSGLLTMYIAIGMIELAKHGW